MSSVAVAYPTVTARSRSMADGGHIARPPFPTNRIAGRRPAAWTSSRSTTPTSPSFRGRGKKVKALKVLIVEDDIALRTFYELALLEHGHAVNGVGNGAEALSVVSPEIDLVVTDLKMPVMPGDQLIAELRAKPEFRDLPVLVVTAHPQGFSPELRDEKTAVLRKPFELDDFLRWVDAAAGARRVTN